MEKESFGRIAKFIAESGLCSRRDAEKLITQGRVKLGEQIITSPALNVSVNDIVYVDDKIIKPAEKTRLWLYYKPIGLVTTHHDPQNRPTVFGALKDSLPRVISVGRLDLNSEGLLLLTNSGTLAREFELPKNKLERVYKVRAYGNISNLMNGFAKTNCTSDKFELSEVYIMIKNIIYTAKRIKLLSEGRTNSWFEVTLTEGKNREIRKIFEHFALKVNRLIRIQYGKYKLGNMEPGEFQEVNWKK